MVAMDDKALIDFLSKIAAQPAIMGN